MTSALLEVKNLKVEFVGPSGPIVPVDSVSFSLHRGETHCLVGESGCGKSVTALSLMRLINPGKILPPSSIELEGQEISQLSEDEMRALRGKCFGMIFQEPMTSLNPVYTVGAQVMEPLLLHQKLSRKQARARTIELFQEVGISDAERRLEAYPYELSGGLRQRVVIAMAISCRPKILIADEPTTSLDVTIQAQILKLLKSLQEKYQMGLLLITHDLGVVAEVANRVSVMYTGKIVETASVSDFFKNPLHPYSRGLLASIPRAGKELQPIPGMVPSLRQLPPGCTFHPRCQYKFDPCDKLAPQLLPSAAFSGTDNHPHRTRCHLVHPLEAAK